jgi:hypothetical protein
MLIHANHAEIDRANSSSKRNTSNKTTPLKTWEKHLRRGTIERDNRRANSHHYQSNQQECKQH